MQNKHYSLIVILLFVMLLTGCTTGPGKAARYYLIDPVSFDNLPGTEDGSLSIEIVDLHIPQYLERFHIATRAGEGRLAFAEHHQWGENLRKNLLRTLARNLSALLSTHDIGTPLNRSASRPDYRLQVYVEQFEQDSDNSVRLIARWQLTTTGQQQPVGIFATELEGDRATRSGNYDDIVAMMRKLYGQMSEEIAASILASHHKN